MKYSFRRQEWRYGIIHFPHSVQEYKMVTLELDIVRMISGSSSRTSCSSSSDELHFSQNDHPSPTAVSNPRIECKVPSHNKECRCKRRRNLLHFFGFAGLAKCRNFLMDDPLPTSGRDQLTISHPRGTGFRPLCGALLQLYHGRTRDPAKHCRVGGVVGSF